ncbi:nickel transporter [Salipiger pallidus]|uniref:Nickel transporter n=1 Tax=Salipiger pallidus TaxID=1775170 RepID=A0A8J2ZLC4_9RHOB|nr:Hpt domain-containing protein [Salipiger pallidus]GGG79009.1 nickel transporter [Salipiger pallidus]
MIDWNRIAELRDEIGIDDFHEVVDLFLREVEDTLDHLPDAPCDAANLERQLHFLKGSALNLGFKKLAALCQAGEVGARNGVMDAIDTGRIRTAYVESRSEFFLELEARLAA